MRHSGALFAGLSFLLFHNVIAAPTTILQSQVQEADSTLTAASTREIVGIPFVEVLSSASRESSTSTTTKTVYTATGTPSSSPLSTTSISVTTTHSNPLCTNAKSSSSLSLTLTTSTYTSALIISTTVTVPCSTTSQLSSSAKGSTGELISFSTNTPVSTPVLSNYQTSSSIVSSLAPSLFYPNSTASSLEVSAGIPLSSGSSSLRFIESASLVTPTVTVLSELSFPATYTTLLEATSTYSALPTSSTKSSTSSTLSTAGVYTYDLFQAISTDEPSSIFTREQLPLEILEGVSNDRPFETNKFYTNFILDEQDLTAWTYPYGLWKYSDTSYQGLAVTQTSSSQYVFGDTNDLGASSYYINPTGIASVILSATSFTYDNFDIDVSELKDFSVLVTLFDNTSDSSTNYLDLSLVQGMGFVTGVYNGDLVPLLNSATGFSSVVQETSAGLASGILKYVATLFNEVEWVIYVTLPDGYSTSDFEFTIEDSYNLQGSTSIDGLIVQVARLSDSGNEYYDEAAGMYVTTAKMQGTTDGSSAEFSISYTTEGNSASGETILFALPHHLSLFTSETSNQATGISLDSTTKGKMEAYLTTSFNFEIDFSSTSINWLPWSQQLGSNSLTYSSEQLQLLATVANDDLSVDMTSQVSGISNYYGGKIIDKFAYILLVVDQILQDDEVTQSTLTQIKDAFDVYLNNEQLYPLIYDTRYGGVTSSASQDGDTGADFGAGYYNDHHFHYGYFIHAAAVIGYIDSKYGGDWVETNKDWVNALVRDVANPSEDDTYFPVSRSFDWYHGHSWAAGLFSAADGKNEESSSEDYNFAFGMKLWGNVIGDESMESRGNLMLSIMQLSLNSYFLYSDDNDVEPSSFIPNKVSGILFDNKIDHTTYFGTNIEYIQGIHMLPITPVSSMIRGPEFVEQEWSEVLSSQIDSVDSGWTGILRLNQALYDPDSSYEFFSQDSFDSNWLDDGQSRTWCLAFSGGLSESV